MEWPSRQRGAEVFVNRVLAMSVPATGQRTSDNQSHSESPWNAALEVWAGQLSLENELLPCLPSQSALATVPSLHQCVRQEPREATSWANEQETVTEVSVPVEVS